MSKSTFVKPVVRSAYSNRDRVQIDFSSDSGMTQQHFASEADVNFIMAKYGASRMFEHFSQFEGDYQDFSDMPDYQSMCNDVIKAQEMFMTLPAKVRNQFQNDPAQFLSFVTDDSNYDEMKSMGLLRDDLVAPESIKNLPDEGSPPGSTRSQ